ncbi:hypothetical protein AB0E88_27525 [Streptomyces sp. NPDC028635]|uniref:hypothetical protein n=1 Tax=Streptomyces sp. NPDC028635 TaxID=3154800 RepID=UPI0033D72D5E
MSKSAKADVQAELAACRAAGYCGELDPGGRMSCTRRPNHDGDHVNHYRGRNRPTDTEGYRWSPSGGPLRRPPEGSVP